jgi:glycine oxidase
MKPGTGGPSATDITPAIASSSAIEPLLADVAVIGGGVIGHGIAWEAKRSGRSVVLIDEAPGTGASWAAAGMLAPVSELHYQEEELLELMLESSALWPGFVETLNVRPNPLKQDPVGEDLVGKDTGYLASPTIAVGTDQADRRTLMDLREVQQAHGLAVEPLTIREARLREPLLSPGISCALEIPTDHQVDPRKLVQSFAAALSRHSPGAGTAVAGAASGYAVRENAAALLWDKGRVSGVRLAGGGTVLASETVVANGLAAASLEGLPQNLNLPLRPVYGDILRLRVPDRLRPLLTATVRGIVRGVPVYLVPRQDGTVVIGATQREDGQAAPSAGGVYQLLRDAQALVPAVAELELLEASARARPGTPDNAPLLGRVPAAKVCESGTADSQSGTHVPGLIIATGFFRHGVLLTPAAAVICRELMDGVEDSRWGAFSPGRFPAERPAVPAAAAPGTAAHGPAVSGPAASNPVTFDQNRESA